MLKFRMNFLLVVLACGADAVQQIVPQFKEKPSFVRSCSKKSPNEDDCFQKMFQGIFPYIAPGIPEHGIVSFEPLAINKISVSRNNGQVITLNGSFNNLNIRGPSNATVKRAKLDFEKETLDFDLEIPKLRINATYNLKGNILLLPIVGAGAVNIMLKDIKTSVFTKISVKKLPEEAIRIEQMKVKFSVGGMRIHLDNLFNGNKVLSASFNMFLNQNAKDIIGELSDDLESGLADIFTGLWNTVFNAMPLNQWMT